MKTSFIAFSLIFLMACQIENITATNPSLSKVSGQWKLYKISIGYPMPNGPSEQKITAEEILTFNTTSKEFTRSIDGKVVETSNFDIKELSNGGTATRESIVFTKTNTYSFFTFDESTSSIILYQSTPIGAILADGNSYYYQKIK